MHWFLKFILEMKLYMIRTVPLSTIRSNSLYTRQWCKSYRFVDGFRAAGSGSCCSKAVCMTYTIAECTVNNPDDGQRNCPKHVEFHFQNKFEKLLCLVGFIIKEICHDARSHVTMHGHMNVKNCNKSEKNKCIRKRDTLCILLFEQAAFVKHYDGRWLLHLTWFKDIKFFGKYDLVEMEGNIKIPIRRHGITKNCVRFLQYMWAVRLDGESYYGQLHSPVHRYTSYTYIWTYRNWSTKEISLKSM
jgi:hypothetical protein